MSAARAIKDFARIATTAVLPKNAVGFLDTKPSLLPEPGPTELQIICDRLHHTLDLIPLSTSGSHPRLFRVRQNIVKQMEVLASLISEAARKDLPANPSMVPMLRRSSAVRKC